METAVILGNLSIEVLSDQAWRVFVTQVMVWADDRDRRLERTSMEAARYAGDGSC